MGLLKILLTFRPRELNNYPAIPRCLTVKRTSDATICKLHLKCWINMCLHNTLDAHFPFCSKTQNWEQNCKFCSQVSTLSIGAIILSWWNNNSYIISVEEWLKARLLSNRVTNNLEKDIFQTTIFYWFVNGINPGCITYTVVKRKSMYSFFQDWNIWIRISKPE